jgi:hypothetical protein
MDAMTTDEPVEDEMATEEDEMATEDDEEMYSEEGEEDMEMDMDSEEDGEEYDVTGDEEEETEEDDLDLEAVIRELEDAMAGEEEVSEEDEMGEEPVAEEEMEDEPVSEEEEELDINEIIKALQEMDGEEEEPVAEEEESTEGYKEELEEAYKVITSLKKTINEVNLLNAKLLYTNKLFRTFDLNENQKMKVIENFDRAASLREVKLVYATLGENLNVARKNKTVVKESLASKPMKSSAPKKEIISEGTAVAERFKKLAGLIK